MSVVEIFDVVNTQRHKYHFTKQQFVPISYLLYNDVFEMENSYFL